MLSARRLVWTASTRAGPRAMARLLSSSCRALTSSLLGTFLAVSALILLSTLFVLYEPRGVEGPATRPQAVSDSRIIMGKLGNATAKAELGRAS